MVSSSLPCWCEHHPSQNSHESIYTVIITSNFSLFSSNTFIQDDTSFGLSRTMSVGTDATAFDEIVQYFWQHTVRNEAISNENIKKSIQLKWNAGKKQMLVKLRQTLLERDFNGKILTRIGAVCPFKDNGDSGVDYERIRHNTNLGSINKWCTRWVQ